MDFFNNLNDKLKASEERWTKIKFVTEELVILRENDKGNHNSRRLICVEEILLLLVEELRPISNIGEQVKELQEDIEKMFNPGAKK